MEEEEEEKEDEGQKRRPLLLLLLMMMMKACLPDLHLDTLDIDPAQANKRALLVCRF